jgi:Clostripain family
MPNEQKTVSRPGAPAGPSPCASTKSPADWGIYVYFAADVPDKQMQDAAKNTLRTLASVGSNDKIKITAMIDLPGRNTEYFIIPPRPAGATRWTIFPDRFLANVNSAGINTILDFFEWSNRNCPAKNIALIFWGHGFALDDFDPRLLPKTQQPANTGQGRSADSFPGESGNELKLLYDTTHNSVLNNRDFAQAIRDYKERFNDRKRIQVLGLDCCNMAMAEVLSELQGVAEYAVAAETGLPFQSWLTAPILQTFLANPGSDAGKFATGAVQNFIGSMVSPGGLYVELSACNLGKFKDLEIKISELVCALLPAIDKFENRNAIARAWLSDVTFVPDGLIDLYSFCDFLGKYINDNAVKAAAEKVKKAVEGKTGGVVELAQISPPVKGQRISLSKGLSIWFPPWIQFPNVRYIQIKQSKDYLFNRSNGYSSTHFAKVTGWDRFLLKLFALTQR